MSDRPALVEEIEVTPEMTLAARDILTSFDGGYFDCPEDILEKIYLTMWRAREVDPLGRQVR